MTHMDHAAAHERIEDLILEPTRLATLRDSTEADDVALLDHLAGCQVCRADLESWRQLQHRLAVALPGSAEAAAAAVDPIEVPPSLRAAVITAARGADRSPAPRSSARERPSRMSLGWLGMAASIVILAGAAVITLDQASRRADANAAAQALSSAIAAVDRVLAAPDHRVVALTDTTGSPGGSISWSSRDLVVLTTALRPPPDGQRYRCWLLDGDTSTAIGNMYFAGRTAYWVGSLDEWATFRIGATTRFAVTLQEADATSFAGPVYLSADLGG
jgi:hypothetical protein